MLTTFRFEMLVLIPIKKKKGENYCMIFLKSWLDFEFTDNRLVFVSVGYFPS